MNNLFDEKILNKKANEEVDLSKNNLSERRKNLDKWISMYESGVLENSKEEEFQGEFLYDIFTKVLNATNKSDGKTEWNLERETKTAIDGQKADGVLGFFNAKGEKDIRAVIELKGANISLDARQKREKDTRTPVEQAFGYAPKYGKNCQWVIVSNFKEIRLYRSSSMLEYQVFKLENLRDDLEFKKFIYVLSFYALVGTENKKAKTLELSEEFQKKQNDIEKKFYREYKQIRLDVFENMRKNNNINENILIEKVQKLLDRFLFICFCEDKDLIPANSYRKVLEIGANIGDNFESFKMLCNWINSGSPKNKIPHFNGGLFKDDEILNSLIVDNEVFEKMEKIADYDFDSELNENILGHIFEQSISDIEELKNSFGGEEENKKVSKRKKDGIFYTPKYITKYIVENSINYWLENKRKELGEDDLPELTEKDEVKDIYKKKFTKNFKKHIEFWEKYREAVRNIKIVDPACGSGAFLIVAFEFLLNYNKYLDDKIFDMVGTQDLFSDKTKEILENNIYGVDLNKESIEITKLSLWLKTADKNKTLTTLEDNIKCGNSLIADREIAGDLAFDWEKEFPSVFEQGGFDIVVGNPPYVQLQKMKEQSLSLKELDYKTYESTGDLYCLFFEKGNKLLKENGILGFITSNKWMRANYGKSLRKYFNEYTEPLILIDLGSGIFESATVDSNILIFKKKNNLSPMEEKEKPPRQSATATPPKEGNGVVEKRNSRNYLELPYNPKLKERAKELRKAGNLSEILFWQQVKNKQFKGLDFDRQKIIGNYIVDFYCASHNVVVEIDGSSHDDKQEYDEYRDEYLKGLGLEVIHILDTDIKNRIENVMEFLFNHSAFTKKKNSPPMEGCPKGGVVKPFKKEEELKSFIALDLTKEDKFIDFSLFEDKKIKVSFSDDEIWTIENPIEKKIKEKIESKGTPLKDWDIQINRGILTGYNEAFIIDKETKEKLVEKDIKSLEILKPILRGRDIGRYYVDFEDLYLINLHNGYGDKERVKVENYPAVKEYLDKFYDKLEKRYDKGATPYNLRNCAYLEEFEKEKIIYQEMVQKSSFSYFKNETMFCVDTGRIITGNSIKFLLPIFNSKLFFYSIKNFYGGGNLGEKGVRMKHTFFEKFQVPILKKEAQTPFIEKADLMLELNKNFQENLLKFQRLISRNFNLEKLSKKLQEWYLLDFSSFLKELKKNKIKISLQTEMEWEEIFEKEKNKILEIKILIEKTDKEIDKMIYDLYELSEEEIKIIEEE